MTAESEGSGGGGQGPKAGTRMSAAEIHGNIVGSGEEELHRKTSALFFSSLGSGLAISFSFLAGGFVTGLVAPEYETAAMAAVYPLGFILVIIARMELFTENTVVPVIPLLHDPGMTRFMRLIRVWVILLVGNLLGAIIISLVIARTGMVPAHFHPDLSLVAGHAVEGGFWEVAYKAVFAGWLIALLSWVLASTYQTGAQLVLIWLCTAPIAAFGFRHSIAGAVEAFYLASRGEATWMEMLNGFVVPAVLGNAVGGVLLVALLNHAQVAPEMESETQFRPVGGPGVSRRARRVARAPR